MNGKRLFLQCACLAACVVATSNLWAVNDMSKHAPFLFLQEVDVAQVSDAAKHLEDGAMAFMQSDYVVTARRFFLLTDGIWVAYVKQMDAAARDWKGIRQDIKGARAGIDRVELWADAKGQRAEALAMSRKPIDEQGHYLLGYFTLSPVSGH